MAPTSGLDMSHTTPLSLTVSLPGPLDLAASLEIFRRSGDDLIDRWDGTTLVRTMPAGTRTVAYAATAAGTMEAPALRVTVEDQSAMPIVIAALEATFLPPTPMVLAALRTDPLLTRLLERYPGLRPVRQFDLLAALVRCISAQQVNLRWAVTTRRRLAETFGERHLVAGQEVYSLPAARLAAASVAEIRALQFTTRKAESIIAVAETIASGGLDLPSLAALPDDEVIARLTALRGIGRWSAEWILARTLGRPRVVAGDLGVRKAVGLAYLGTPSPSEEAVRQLAATWGVAGGMAQALLLHALAEGTLTE